MDSPPPSSPQPLESLRMGSASSRAHAAVQATHSDLSDELPTSSSPALPSPSHDFQSPDNKRIPFSYRRRRSTDASPSPPGSQKSTFPSPPSFSSLPLSTASNSAISPSHAESAYVATSLGTLEAHRIPFSQRRRRKYQPTTKALPMPSSTLSATPLSSNSMEGIDENDIIVASSSHQAMEVDSAQMSEKEREIRTGASSGVFATQDPLEGLPLYMKSPELPMRAWRERRKRSTEKECQIRRVSPPNGVPAASQASNEASLGKSEVLRALERMEVCLREMIEKKLCSEDVLEVVRENIAVMETILKGKRREGYERTLKVRQKLNEGMQRIRLKMVSAMTETTQFTFEALEEIRSALITQILADEEFLQHELERIDSEMVKIIQPLHIIEQMSATAVQYSAHGLASPNPVVPTFNAPVHEFIPNSAANAHQSSSHIPHTTNAQYALQHAHIQAQQAHANVNSGPKTSPPPRTLQSPAASTSPARLQLPHSIAYMAALAAERRSPDRAPEAFLPPTASSVPQRPTTLPITDHHLPATLQTSNTQTASNPSLVPPKHGFESSGPISSTALASTASNASPFERTSSNTSTRDGEVTGREASHLSSTSQGGSSQGQYPFQSVQSTHSSLSGPSMDVTPTQEAQSSKSLLDDFISLISDPVLASAASKASQMPKTSEKATHSDIEVRIEAMKGSSSFSPVFGHPAPPNTSNAMDIDQKEEEKDEGSESMSGEEEGEKDSREHSDVDDGASAYEMDRQGDGQDIQGEEEGREGLNEEEEDDALFLSSLRSGQDEMLPDDESSSHDHGDSGDDADGEENEENEEFQKEDAASVHSDASRLSPSESHDSAMGEDDGSEEAQEEDQANDEHESSSSDQMMSVDEENGQSMDEEESNDTNSAIEELTSMERGQIQKSSALTQEPSRDFENTLHGHQNPSENATRANLDSSSSVFSTSAPPAILSQAVSLLHHKDAVLSLEADDAKLEGQKHETTGETSKASFRPNAPPPSLSSSTVSLFTTPSSYTLANTPNLVSSTNSSLLMTSASSIPASAVATTSSPAPSLFSSTSSLSASSANNLEPKQ